MSHFPPSLAVNLKLLFEVLSFKRKKKNYPDPGAHILQGQSAEIRTQVTVCMLYKHGQQVPNTVTQRPGLRLIPAPTHPGQPLLKGQYLRQACILGLPHSLGGRGPKLPSVHPHGVWAGDACVSAELGWTSPGQRPLPLSHLLCARGWRTVAGLPLWPLPSGAL